MPLCQQCVIVKKILEKYGKKYDIEEHYNSEFDEYPLIIMDGEKYRYRDFLKFVNNGGLNKKVEK